MIGANANLNKEDSNGWAPLHLAAEKGDTSIVRILIEAGADSRKEDNDEITPLHMAAMKGHITIVRKLIAADANIDKADMGEFTPLHLAASVIMELVKYGAELVESQKKVFQQNRTLLVACESVSDNRLRQVKKYLKWLVFDAVPPTAIA